MKAQIVHFTFKTQAAAIQAEIELPILTDEYGWTEDRLRKQRLIDLEKRIETVGVLTTGFAVLPEGTLADGDLIQIRKTPEGELKIDWPTTGPAENTTE